MHLNCHPGLILMCVCCPSGIVNIETEKPCGTYTYMDESSICGHHVSKDFCTPVINGYAVAVKKGSLRVGHVPRKTSAIVRCY